MWTQFFKYKKESLTESTPTLRYIRRRRFLSTELYSRLSYWLFSWGWCWDGFRGTSDLRYNWRRLYGPSQWLLSWGRGGFRCRGRKNKGWGKDCRWSYAHTIIQINMYQDLVRIFKHVVLYTCTCICKIMWHYQFTRGVVILTTRALRNHESSRSWYINTSVLLQHN